MRLNKFLDQSLFHNALFRNMLTLATGAIVSRSVAVVSMPILTRLYSPQAFGILTVFQAIVLFFGPNISLRYSVAIPLPKKEKILANLIFLSGYIALCFLLIISLSLSIFAHSFFTMVSLPEVSSYWPLLVFAIMANSFYEIFSMWALRDRHFKIMTTTLVSQSVIGEGTKAVLGMLGMGPVGLLTGFILTQGSGVFQYAQHYKSKFITMAQLISMRRMLYVLCLYRSFPLYRLPSQLLLAFASQAPLLFISMRFDKATTGQVGLAVMAMALPSSLIGQSIGKAYYSEVARLGKENAEKIRILTTSIQKKLFVLSFPIAVLIFFFGEPVFAIVFGSDWRLAGYIASTFSLFTILQLTSAPLIQALNVFEQQKVFLLLNLMRAAMLFGLFAFTSVINPSIEIFCWYYSILMTVFYLLVSISIFKVISNEADKQSRCEIKDR